MRAPRVALLAVAALAALVSPAAAVPRFGAVAEGSLPAMPVTASSPSAVDEGAVAWLLVQGLGAPVAPVGRGAAAGKKGKGKPVFESSQVSSPEGGCLRVMMPGRSELANEELVLNRAEGIVPVQRERVIRDGQGGARFEVRQAWVDVRSLASVAIAQAQAPLTRLLPTYHGLDTWGVREAGGLRVVVSVAPEAVGAKRGMLQERGCSLTLLALRDDPDGHQESVELSQLYFDHAAPGETEISQVSRSLRLTGSLSRVSRDREPLLGVFLRFADNLPPPVRETPPAP